MVTLQNRIGSLDALRGIAVLGILLANIMAFAVPSLESRQTMSLPENSLDAWVEVVRQWLVTGKFRGMLAILFGIGLHMQFTKRSAAQSWPMGYVRRTLFLALIGFVHAVFIWYGDILFLYACTALVAMLFVKLPTNKIIPWIAGFGIFAFFLGMGLMFLMNAMPTDGPSQLGPLEPYLGEQAEIETFARGSYFSQVALRLLLFVIAAMQIFLMLPSLLTLFLTGILLGRTGFLAKPSAHPQIKKWGWICFAAGLFTNAVPMLSYALGSRYGWGYASEFSLSPILAFGYLTLGATIYEMRPRLLALVEPVGKMALTSYLLQSLLCTFIFYSWGLGWFNRLSAIEMLLAVAVTWVIVIIFAHLWLSRYSIGPIEGVWRSWSERQKIPWRRPSTVSSDA